MHEVRERNDLRAHLMCSYLGAHVLISVLNVHLSPDKTDEPSESPSCLGVEEKTQVQYSGGDISLLSNSAMTVSSKCVPLRGENIHSD